MVILDLSDQKATTWAHTPAYSFHLRYTLIVSTLSLFPLYDVFIHTSH